MKNISYSENRRGGSKLVATNAPEGLIVHTECGVTEDVARGVMRSAISGTLKNPRYVIAADVGLEWRGNGTDVSPREWLHTCYVLVSEKE